MMRELGTVTVLTVRTGRKAMSAAMLHQRRDVEALTFVQMHVTLPVADA
jgi:hypothetical protein